MSFKAPGSETPNKLLVHHPGFINHFCCLQNRSVKMDLHSVEETLIHELFRQEDCTDVNYPKQLQ